MTTDIDLDDLSGPDPYPAYARLRRDAPVHRTPLGIWLLSRYDDVRQVQVDARFRSSMDAWPAWPGYADAFLGGVQGPIARLHRHMFVFMDDHGHDRMRGLFRRAFTARVIERLREAVQERVDRLLDAAEDSGRLEVMDGLALPLTIAVICDLLGVPEDDRRLCRERADLVRETFGPPVEAARRPAIEAAVTESGLYFRGLVDVRRATPSDDLLSALAVADGGADVMSPDELAATAILLFGAGHETTAALIGNGLHDLLTHPGQRELLHAKPDLLPAAVEEMLRYDAPFQYMRKFTAEEVTLSGVTIPPGEMVIGLIGAANRDPDRFPEPDRFDLTRTGERHLSFGTGLHHCLGAQLARLEAKIAIGTLLRRWPRLALTPGGARRPLAAGSLRLLDSLEITKEPLPSNAR